MSDLSPVGEHELIQKARSGDTDAFGRLYEANAPAVFRFLYAHLDDRLDAEDLTEETFLRVWQALPGYREQGAPFGGFLFRVARNVLYDHYRQTRRRPSSAMDRDFVDDQQPDPAVVVPEHLERREMHRVMGALREDQRLVLSLRFLAGLSPEETAQAMGRSAGSIRVLQHRALAALRKLLVRPEEAQGGAQTGRTGFPGVSETD
jgi:RNA polymerase sigma-70 factor, ECF subfamily